MGPRRVKRATKSESQGSQGLPKLRTVTPDHCQGPRAPLNEAYTRTVTPEGATCHSLHLPPYVPQNVRKSKAAGV